MCKTFSLSIKYCTPCVFLGSVGRGNIKKKLYFDQDFRPSLTFSFLLKYIPYNLILFLCGKRRIFRPSPSKEEVVGLFTEE